MGCGLERRRPATHFRRVLLFQRIFDFKRATLARLRDKRRAQRHAMAPGFPLKATVHLLGVDNPGKVAAPAGLGLAWSGAVIDMSGEGLSLRLPPAAATMRGEKTQLTLTLEDLALSIPCTVAHFRTQSAGALCGVSLQFEDDIQRKGYLQLLEAVVLGAGFSAAKPVKPREGFAIERYHSEGKARLTIWREQGGGRPLRFELVLGEHLVRGDANRAGLEVLTGKEPQPAGAEKPEVIRLYRIVIANLPKEMPADLRAWLQAPGKPPPPAPRR